MATADDSQQLPQLPPNVSIFAPPNQTTTEALFSQVGTDKQQQELEQQRRRIFTRLTLSDSSIPSTHISETLQQRPDLQDQTFWLVHQHVVLVFDAAGAGAGDDTEETVKDRHHEHVRSICLALKELDWGLSISGCVFDAAEAVGAGFQFDGLSGGAVLVVDLMDGGEDEDMESDSDEDEDFDSLAGAETVA